MRRLAHWLAGAMVALATTASAVDCDKARATFGRLLELPSVEPCTLREPECAYLASRLAAFREMGRDPGRQAFLARVDGACDTAFGSQIAAQITLIEWWQRESDRLTFE